MVFKSLRDGEVFFKLASLEMNAWFSSLIEMVKLFSSLHLIEMVKLFSKIHFWRWIHGHHQVIISGAFLQRRCSIFQRFISGDGNVVLVPSSLLLIRDMVNVFFNYSFTIFVNVQYMICKKLPHRQMTGNP